MADTFNVEVRETISPKIREKLLQIALAATEGAISLERLQNKLDKLGIGGLEKLANAETNAAIAAAKLADAENKAAQSALNALTAGEKLANATDKTKTSALSAAIALEKLAAAENQTATSALNGLAASERLAAAQTKVATAATNAAIADQRLIASQNQVATSALNGLAASERLAAATSNAATAQQKVAVATSAAAMAQARAQAATIGTATAQQKLAQASTNAATATVKGAAAATQGQTAQQRLAASVAVTAAAQDRAAVAALRLAAAQQGGGVGAGVGTGAGGGIGGALDQLHKFYYRLLAVYALYQSFKVLIDTADTYTNLQNKLKQLSGDQAEVNELTNKLLDISIKAHAPLEATVTLFARISNAVKDVGGSEQDAIKITEGLAKAIANSGLAVAEQDSALRQVSQSFNKGKLDSDEFRSVMENFPPLAREIAKTLGFANTGMLFEASEKGKIRIEALMASTKNLSDTMDQQLSRATVTVGQAFGDFSGAATVLIGMLDKTYGVTAKLVEGFNYLTKSIKEAIKSRADFGSADSNAALAAESAGLDIRIKKQEEFISKRKALEEKIPGFSLFKPFSSAKDDDLILENLKKQKVALDENIKKAAQYTIAQDITDTNKTIQNRQAADSKKSADAASFLTGALNKAKLGGIQLNEELSKVKENIETLQKLKPAADSAEGKVLALALKNRTALEAAITKRDTPNVPKGSSIPKGPKYSEEELRSTQLNRVTQELDKQIASYDKVAEVRLAQQKLTEIDIQLESKHHAKLTPKEKSGIEEQIKQVEANKRVTASIDQIYNTAKGPMLKYEADLKAIAIELKNTDINQKEAEGAIKATTFAYEQSKDPLFNFNRELEQHINLLGLSAKAREVEAQVIQVLNALLPTEKSLTDAQTNSLRDQLKAVQELSKAREAYDDIISRTTGAQEDLKIRINALSEAWKNSTNDSNDAALSTAFYTNELAKLNVEQANLNLSQGTGTFVDIQTSALGKLVEGYTNATQGIANSFGDMYTGITDGASNSIGKVIVMGDSLRDSLQNVAQTVLSQLIGSLIKLGFQYVVNATLGQSVAAAATVVSAGLATATAAAWAPAAAMVSLASYGANSIPASEGILATNILSKLLATTGFEEGGYTGNGGTKEVAGVVHGKEFVVNARATAANRATLEAMNRGSTVGKNPNFNLNVQNLGTPQEYEVTGVTANEVRMIARDVSRETVARHAPSVVASDLNNPNSVLSKSMNRNTNTVRKR